MGTRHRSGGASFGGGAAVARALAVVATASLLAGPANGQFSLDPFPGTAPTKTVSGAELRWDGTGWITPPGSTIEWTIHVVNDGWDPAVSIDLVDDVPDPSDALPVAPFDPATDVVEAPADGDLTYTGDWLQLTGTILDFGESFDLRFVNRIDADAPDGTEICNRASVTYVESNGDEGPIIGLPRRWRNWTETSAGEIAPTCVRVATGVPLLSESTKVAEDADGDGVLEPGEEVTFTITVRNTGDAATADVVVVDDVTPPLTLVSAGQGAVVTGDSARWDSTTTPELGRLTPGESTVLTLVARLDGCPSEPACNQAQVSSAQIATPVGTDDPGDAVPGSATCIETAAPRLAGSPLTAADASGDGTFAAGEALTYEFILTNGGAADAVDVDVRLPLPPEIDSAVAGQGGSVAAGEALWTAASTPELARVGPGASVRLTVDGVVSPATGDGASLCTRAFAAPAGCAEEASDDPALGGEDDETCFAVVAVPELVVAVSATDPDADGVVLVGEVVEYEVTVSVASGAAAQDVVVELVLPPGDPLDAVEADAGGLVGAGLVSWDATTTPELASVAVGSPVVLTARGTASCRLEDGEAACADAVADATNVAAPVGAALPACVTTAEAVFDGFALTATDASGDGAFEAGETVTLDLLVRNDGTAAADDVLVTLPLDPAALDVVASDGGAVFADRVEWTAGTTPALASVMPGAAVPLSVSLRLDPAAAGERACHAATAAWSVNEDCPAAASDDPDVAGATDPTCFDVSGDGLPPVEVPDGDPLSAGGEPVRLSCVGGDLHLRWDATLRADTYLVYRGPLASFSERPWTNPAAPIDDPEDALVSCDLDALEFLDERECEPGRADVYYLVGARNLVGDGPLGEQRRGAALEPRTPVTAPCP